MSLLDDFQVSVCLLRALLCCMLVLAYITYISCLHGPYTRSVLVRVD